jgi:hypothetical protein
VSVAFKYGRALVRAMHFLRLALAAAFGVLALCGITPAHASCAIGGPPPTLTAELAARKVAFVGSIVYTSSENRFARVKVESIWKGPRLPAYVDVHGEAPGSGPFSGSEADHQYQTGQTYLFLPLNDHPPFQDYGDCNSSTEVYSSDVATNVPQGAKLPDSPTPLEAVGNFADQYSTAGAIAGSVLAVIVIGLVMRRPRART